MTWTGGEARPGHRLGGTQRLTSPRGGGVLETSSPQDPGDEEHVAVRGNQLIVPDPSSRIPSSVAGGGPYAPRPRRLARAPRCGQGRGAQPRGSRTPASIGRAHASHQPAGFATCDCARLPSTRRSSMGGRGGGGRARTPARVTRRLRRGSTPCRTDAARLVVAGEVLHVRRLDFCWSAE